MAVTLTASSWTLYPACLVGHGSRSCGSFSSRSPTGLLDGTIPQQFVQSIKQFEFLLLWPELLEACGQTCRFPRPLKTVLVMGDRKAGGDRVRHANHNGNLANVDRTGSHENAI